MKFLDHPDRCQLLILRPDAFIDDVLFDHVAVRVVPVADVQRDTRQLVRQRCEGDLRNLPFFMVQQHLNDLPFAVDAVASVKKLN